MLRITEKKEGEKTKVLYLEGKLCRDYVKELQIEITKGIDTGEKLILDFAKVIFLDDAAARMIKSLKDSRLSLRNCSLFIRTALKIEEKNKGEKI
ncbi:MAG: anti-sigma factor antagonist [Candidatus Aminicenantes bacterium]|nr:MAG: anti-sigma factor antagonist [Candidatus Aminicenantes bacterium]